MMPQQSAPIFILAGCIECLLALINFVKLDWRFPGIGTAGQAAAKRWSLIAMTFGLLPLIFAIDDDRDQGKLKVAVMTLTYHIASVALTSANVLTKQRVDGPNLRCYANDRSRRQTDIIKAVPITAVHLILAAGFSTYLILNVSDSSIAYLSVIMPIAVSGMAISCVLLQTG